MSVETGIIRISDGSVRIYLSGRAETVKPDDIMEYIKKNLKIDVYRKTTQGTNYTGYSSIIEYKKLYEDARNHIKFMNEALSEAYKGIGRNDGGPFGSVVVMNGQIIGKGHNNVLLNSDPTAHGEITAIRDACKNFGRPHLDGAVLYTTSYPCPMCLAAMMWAHIDTFYYGCTIEDAKRIGFDDSEFYHRFNDTKSGGIKNIQIMHDECLQLFDYYESLDHQTY